MKESGELESAARERSFARASRAPARRCRGTHLSRPSRNRWRDDFSEAFRRALEGSEELLTTSHLRKDAVRFESGIRTAANRSAKDGALTLPAAVCRFRVNHVPRLRLLAGSVIFLAPASAHSSSRSATASVSDSPLSVTNSVRCST